MEYQEGGTLGDLLEKQTKLEEAEVKMIAM
jgi:hypothetical protein